VPFINNTTGADATALSIADLISEERARKWELDSWGKENGGDFRIHCLGMVARQNAYFPVKHIFKINKQWKDLPSIMAFYRNYTISSNKRRPL
jgi:hypothetical protein